MANNRNKPLKLYRPGAAKANYRIKPGEIYVRGKALGCRETGEER